MTGFIRAARRNQHNTAPKDIRAILPISAWSTPMMDIIMLAIAFVFFAATIAYVYACERL
jgi:hypothetical protein